MSRTTANRTNVDLKRIKENIERIGTRLNNKWYKLNSTDNLGCVTFLYRKYGYPATYQSFYDKYITDHKEGSKTNGRNLQYLTFIAERLEYMDDYTEPFQAYYDFLIQKLIIDTKDGMAEEEKAKKMLEASGFTCTDPTLEEDLGLGIDLKVKKDNKPICAVQVKPHTFFLGNNNWSLVNDRKRAIEKEKKTKEQLNLPTYFFIYYKNDGEFIKTNGKYAHKLQSLINEDGTTKN